MTGPEYRAGDVNHNVQPSIGMLRLRQHDQQPLSERDLEWAITNLGKACDAEKAWLEQTRKS